MTAFARLAFLLPVFTLALPRASAAQLPSQASPTDLTSVTLRDLMNMTVTTATRRAEGAADVPARVQVVTAAQIRSRGYRSLADVFRDLPDFKLDVGSDADYSNEIVVQGTRGTSRVVVLFDGIRISSPTSEPLPILDNYPVRNARQVEIVYGPSSALYGADAFSAVVNIISRDADESAGLSVESSVGQFGLSNQTATYGRRLGSRASLVVSGQYLYDHQPDLSHFYPADFQGLEAQRTGTFNTIFGPMTSTRPISAAYDIPLSAHSVQATLRAGQLQVTFFESRSRMSTSLPYTPDNAVYNSAAFNQNTLVVGAGTYTHVVGQVTWTSTVTQSRHELSPQSGYWNVYSNLDKSYKYAYGSSTTAEQQFSWKASSTIALTVGGTFQHFFSIPQGADLNAPVESRDEPGTILGTNITDDFFTLRYANTGVYGQLQYTMTPTLSLTLGARGDYNTRFGATFNPRAGLVAHVTPATTVKLLYGTAYLAPSPYEAYSHYGSFYSTDGGATFASDYWHLPNPNLKPQRKQSLETTVARRLGSSVSISASAFTSRLTNLIQGADADQSYAGTYHGWPVAYIDFAVNEGHETVYGGTLGTEFVKTFRGDRRLSGYVGLSLADGRVWNDDSPEGHVQLGGMAPVQLRVTGDGDWGPWTVGYRLAGVGAQRLLATTTGPGPIVRRTLPGYATVDVTLRRRHVLRNLGAFMTIENALDARYRNINLRAYTNPEELVGSPQNPRRITVGFDLRIR